MENTNPRYFFLCCMEWAVKTPVITETQAKRLLSAKEQITGFFIYIRQTVGQEVTFIYKSEQSRGLKFQLKDTSK
jgi:hypothetical protein